MLCNFALGAGTIEIQYNGILVLVMVAITLFTLLGILVSPSPEFAPHRL